MSFPDGRDKRQISTEGGEGGRWPRKGPEELYYQNGGKMMAVELKTQPFAVGRPYELFRGSYLSGFDVSPDGQHFLMMLDSEEQPATQVNVVLNWFETLKRVK
jgi:hypothetical protein